MLKRICWPLVFIGYFIINIRVAAGLATGLERVLDCFVAVVLLIVLLYIGARFFNLIEVTEEEDPLVWLKKKIK
jgi:hypothetical protein